MPKAQPLIQLDNVDVEIDGRTILRGIELEIAAGQHWGVVGANGSGKSTLFALLAGRRWPAPGRGIRIYDFGAGPERDAVSARERVALLGHELQDLYTARGWNFQARDIVHSGVTRTDIPQRRAGKRSQAQAEALLESMGLGHLASRRMLELSRGEQRRVLIARSLAFNPALLLLDEPASGLDTEARAGLEATLRRAAERTTIVAAAHRVDELPDVVTNIAVLDSGRLNDPTRSDRKSKPQANDKLGRGRRGNPPLPDPQAVDQNDGMPAAEASVLIALESASAWLGGRQILKDLDWALRSGEHWLITGDNGAGKSTLLRMLHAEIRPARGGRISWPGLGDPRDVWALRTQIALVSPELQARYRFPTRVFDAIASGFHSSIGLVHRLSAKQRDRVDALIAGFQLEPFRDRLLSTLSYGQRHRALIARTLASDPRILLLDEPWEGLDEPTSRIVVAEIDKQMATGTQVVCVSHVGARDLKLNRALRLSGGRIVNARDSAEPPENSASARSPVTNSPRR